MNKKIVIMCPTVNSAVFEWKSFLTRWAPIIKKANRTWLYIELLSGCKIYFKSKTTGRWVLIATMNFIIALLSLMSLT